MEAYSSARRRPFSCSYIKWGKGADITLQGSCVARPSAVWVSSVNMTESEFVTRAHDQTSLPASEKDTVKANVNSTLTVKSEDDNTSDGQPPPNQVPLRWKLLSVLLVSAIGFGSKWSGGITGAMKTTLKKELKINNTQFALLDASEDFMVTVLMLLSGIVTDRIGGAGAMLYGNAIFTVGKRIVLSFHNS